MKPAATTRRHSQKSRIPKTTLAEMAHPLIHRSAKRHSGITGIVPGAVLVIDWQRLPDPVAALAENSLILPRKATILIRTAPQPKPLAEYISLARAARARGYQVLATAGLRSLPTYLISGRHVGEAARRFPAYHGWGLGRRRSQILTFAVHDLPGLRNAAYWGAATVFLSPFFTTASHPGLAALTPWRSRDLCRRSRVPVLALGGVNTTTMRQLRHARITGLAGLDGWRGQNTLPPTISEG